MEVSQCCPLLLLPFVSRLGIIYHYDILNIYFYQHLLKALYFFLSTIKPQTTWIFFLYDVREETNFILFQKVLNCSAPLPGISILCIVLPCSSVIRQSVGLRLGSLGYSRTQLYPASIPQSLNYQSFIICQDILRLILPNLIFFCRNVCIIIFHIYLNITLSTSTREKQK